MKRDAPRQRSGRCCWGIKIQESRHEKSVTCEISCEIIQGNGSVMRRYVDLDVSEHKKIKLSKMLFKSSTMLLKCSQMLLKCNKKLLKCNQMLLKCSKMLLKWSNTVLKCNTIALKWSKMLINVVKLYWNVLKCSKML